MIVKRLAFRFGLSGTSGLAPGIRILAFLAVALNGCGLYAPWDPVEEDVSGGDTGGDMTYFMGEQMDYSLDTPCQGTSLNDVTSDFKATLDAAMWAGQRLADSVSRMHNFYDEAVQPIGYGKDHLYADNARVAVFAGHGHVGIHAWGQLDPEQSECRVITASYNLGTRTGDQNSLFINAASCNGALSSDPDDPAKCFRGAFEQSEFRQWLGFINSPHIDSWQLTTFYQGLTSEYDSASGHVDVWLDVMEWPEAMVHNYPVVYTKIDEYDMQTGHDEIVHFGMNMKTTKHMSDNPEKKPYVVMSPTVGSDQAELAAMCAGGVLSC
ncbi:MAG: hypothetical protein R6X02_06790 [Enhygromyxa sp.]